MAYFENLLGPWPGCSFRVWIIDFRLELQGLKLYQDGIVAWEQGPGLIGGCPGCGQKVLFSPGGKTCVKEDNEPAGALALAENWVTYAIILDEKGNVISL